MGGACRLLLIYKPGLVVSQTPKLQINKYSLTAECCCAKCWRNCVLSQRVQNARAESFCYFDLYSLSSFTRLKAFQPRVLFCMPYW